MDMSTTRKHLKCNKVDSVVPPQLFMTSNWSTDSCSALTFIHRCSSSWHHSCTLYNVSYSEKMKCWGSNYNGQLGYGHTENRGDDLDENGWIFTRNRFWR